MSEPHDLTAMMDRHARFMKMALFVLPSSLMGLDLQRMTLVYFSVSGDFFNTTDEEREDRAKEWTFKFFFVISFIEQSKNCFGKT